MTTQAEILRSMALAKDGWRAPVQDLSELVEGLLASMAWDTWEYLLPGVEGGVDRRRRFYRMGKPDEHVSCALDLAMPAIDGIVAQTRRKVIVTVRDKNGDYRRGQPLAVFIRDASAMRTAEPTAEDASIEVNVLDPDSVQRFYRAASSAIQMIFTDAVTP